jgi:hypothetical protein
MKIISLIKRSRKIRTNKEQNTLRRKLYFLLDVGGTGADLTRDGELPVLSRIDMKWHATIPRNGRTASVPKAVRTGRKPTRNG